MGEIVKAIEGFAAVMARHDYEAAARLVVGPGDHESDLRHWVEEIFGGLAIGEMPADGWRGVHLSQLDWDEDAQCECCWADAPVYDPSGRDADCFFRLELISGAGEEVMIRHALMSN